MPLVSVTRLRIRCVLSKVNHRSAAHLAFQISKPRRITKATQAK